MRITFYLFFIILFTRSAAYGQADTIRTVELADVVISENRLQTPFSESARSITIITREQIDNAPVQSINELLTYVAGVDIRQRGPAGVQADVSVRGGTFEQTLILINGVKVSDPQTGHHQLNLPLDRHAIERIEVLKGPAARIYGQNAFAGAINIITKVPEERAVIIGGYGGGFTTFGGNVGWALPGERYGQYLTLSHDRSEGYRPNADYRITNAFYQSYLNAGSGTFTLMGGHTRRAFGAGGFYVPDSEEYEEVTTTFASVDYQAKLDRWTVQPRIYWRRNHDDYVFKRSDPGFFNNLHTTHTWGAELNTTRTSDWGLTGLGAEFREEAIASTNLGDRSRSIAGFFVEHRFYFFDRLDVTPGVYLNWFSDYGWNWFPGIDASCEFGPAWRAFANVGRSFRIPTYTDLYYQGPTNIGNDQLRAEDALTYEGGVKYFGANLWGQVSYFRRDASQLIDWVRTSDDNPWQPRNFYNVAVQGLEAGINFDFAADAWFKTLSLNYTYLDADLKDTEGVQSRYALDNLNHQLVLGADHKIWSKVRHNLRARYLDRATLPDYFILDSRVYYRTERFEVYIEATNLTNTEYTETGYVTMPGRWVRAGVSLTLRY